MTELTWILDPATGDLTVEGLSGEQVAALLAGLLPPAQEVNCGRPLQGLVPLAPGSGEGLPVRVYRLYHGSVVDGPGRRSVLQVAGCPLSCPQCFLPRTHDPAGGVAVDVAQAVQRLLDPAGEPRDGVTVTGGEPFSQPQALAAVLERLKRAGVHTTVYTGYRLEALLRRPDPAVHQALAHTDLLVDGPFMAALAQGAGEWRGSRNQRLIARPGRFLDARPAEEEEGRRWT